METYEKLEITIENLYEDDAITASSTETVKAHENAYTSFNRFLD